MLIFNKSKISNQLINNNDDEEPGTGCIILWWYRNKRKLKRSFKTLFWSIIFIICELLIIFYFGTISIPNNNIFNINFNN